MIENRKKIEIKDSTSKLSFTTTGGGSWEVWDRFISYDGEQLFHIGNICGTCAFFFRQVKADLKSSYTIDEIRENLNIGIKDLNDGLLHQLSALFPNGEYEVLLLKIYPYETFFNDNKDYFKNEQSKLWYYGNDGYYSNDDEESIISERSYYRGVDRIIDASQKVFEFFIPLYQTSQLDEERVKYYQNQIKQGLVPTAIALSVVDAKECVIYDEEPVDGITCHWSFANYLLDGHHKMQAAAREGKPITLISFITKDHSWKVINKLIEIYEKEIQQ